MNADLCRSPAAKRALAYRTARPEDAAACMTLRGQTRQNAVSAERLRALGITERSWAEDIRQGELPGHLCSSQGRMVGYCFGSRSTGEIVVLALLPAFEQRGIGKALLTRMTHDLVTLGHQRLFLGCSTDPQSRSWGFYRHLGWRPTGELDRHGDEILECFPKTGRRSPLD
jgi:ribosomal protein S18 acetylase RimI-like enzyme